jgi:hypothetical protein
MEICFEEMDYYKNNFSPKHELKTNNGDLLISRPAHPKLKEKKP